MLAEAPRGPLHGVPIAVKDMFSLPWRGPRDGTRDEHCPPGESGVYRLPARRRRRDRRRHADALLGRRARPGARPPTARSATRGTPSTAAAGRRAARPRRSARGWWRARSAPTAAGRSGCRPPTTGSPA